MNDNLPPNAIYESISTTSDIAIISEDNKNIKFESITSTVLNISSDISPTTVCGSKYESGACNSPALLHWIDNVASNISDYSVPKSAVKRRLYVNPKTEDILAPNIGDGHLIHTHNTKSAHTSITSQHFEPPTLQVIENVVPSISSYHVPIFSPVDTMTNESSNNEFEIYRSVSTVERSVHDTAITFNATTLMKVAGNKCANLLCNYSPRTCITKGEQKLRFFRFPFNDETRL